MTSTNRKQISRTLRYSAIRLFACLLSIIALYSKIDAILDITAEKKSVATSKTTHSLDQEQKNQLPQLPSRTHSGTLVSPNAIPINHSTTQTAPITQKTSSKTPTKKKNKKVSVYKRMYAHLRVHLRTIASSAVGLFIGVYYVPSLFEGQIKVGPSSYIPPKPDLPRPQLPPTPPPSAAEYKDPSTMFPLKHLTLNNVDRTYTEIFKIAEEKAQNLTNADRVDIEYLYDLLSPDEKLITAIQNCAEAISRIENKLSVNPDKPVDLRHVVSEITSLAKSMKAIDDALTHGANPNTIVNCSDKHSNKIFYDDKEQRQKRGYQRIGDLNHCMLTTTYPAWIFAIRTGCPYVVVKKLIDHGAHINTVDGEKNNALWALYDYYLREREAHWVTVQGATIMVDNYMININIGETEDALSILNILLKAGINSDTTHRSSKKTVLSRILSSHTRPNQNFEPYFVRALINHGARLELNVVSNGAQPNVDSTWVPANTTFANYLTKLKAYRYGHVIFTDWFCKELNIPKVCANKIRQFILLYPKDRAEWYGTIPGYHADTENEEDEKEKKNDAQV